MGRLLNCVAVAAAAVVQEILSNPGPAAPGCPDCGAGLTPETCLRFNCCGAVYCQGCAGRYVTPAGGDSYRLRCTCGADRLSTVRRS